MKLLRAGTSLPRPRRERLLAPCRARIDVLITLVCLAVLALNMRLDFKVMNKKRDLVVLVEQQVERHREDDEDFLAVVEPEKQPSEQQRKDEDDAAMIMIPKKLHFVWVSVGIDRTTEQPPMPETETRHVSGWKKLHPDWEVIVWDNHLVWKTFPGLAPMLASLPVASWVSNLLRYAVVERFGGVYLDTDIAPIRNLEPLTKQYSSGFTVCERTATEDLKEVAGMSWDDCNLVCTAVIGASPNRLVLGSALSTAVNNTLKILLRGDQFKRYKTSITGPPMWTGVVQEHRKEHPDDGLTVLLPKTFFPCNYTDSKEACAPANFANDTMVFASHQWAKSWK